jgi:hypothetical protein
MSKRRREFLGWLGASTLLAAGGRSLGAQGAAAPGDRRSPLRPVSAEWDMSWVDRVHGDARAVFDAPTADDGSCVWRASRWLEDYRAVYGVKPPDITAVLVVRHEAIPMVMDNEYWSRFAVGKALAIKGRSGKQWAVENPVSAGGSDSGSGAGLYTMERFIAGGGIVLACHMAFRARVVDNYRKTDELDSEQAEEQARKHLLPGVILQPTGIFAALRAQQAGCAYVMAS